MVLAGCLLVAIVFLGPRVSKRISLCVTLAPLGSAENAKIKKLVALAARAFSHGCDTEVLSNRQGLTLHPPSLLLDTTCIAQTRKTCTDKRLQKPAGQTCPKHYREAPVVKATSCVPAVGKQRNFFFFLFSFFLLFCFFQLLNFLKFL